MDQEAQGLALAKSVIDHILTAQFAVAWAGESADEAPRLGWWRSDLISDFGGQDLFREMLPNSWEWAVFQAVREAARRKDFELRGHGHNSDQILTLFNLGFAVDERAEDRIGELKRSGKRPAGALPALDEVITEDWNADVFGEWVQGCKNSSFVKEPMGRRLKGSPPESYELLVNHLVSALWPVADAYPLSYYRRHG